MSSPAPPQQPLFRGFSRCQLLTVKVSGEGVLITPIPQMLSDHADSLAFQSLQVNHKYSKIKSATSKIHLSYFNSFQLATKIKAFIIHYSLLLLVATTVATSAKINIIL